ncbi:MAG: hypothetical protein ACI91B_001492 [Planctomycetota bacterium]
MSIHFATLRNSRLMPSGPPIRVLVLFPGEWDEHALTELEADGTITAFREGFDVRRFPQCLKVIWFDAHRFLDQLCRKYRGRIDAVWSNDEQFGCLLAALLADRLSLPGTSPEVVVRAQHKLLMRQALAQAVPDATVAAHALPWQLRDARWRDPEAIAAAVVALGLSWPLFFKPIKGTFSVLARRADSAQDLAKQLRLSRVDYFSLRRLIRPFESLASRVIELPCPSDHLLAEQAMHGRQVNVDGYARSGRIHILGIVDECTYATRVGAQHFMGFTYPSRWREPIRSKLVATVTASLRAIGFDYGQFNVELFVQDDGSVRVIEINPRAAAQFTTFYRDVEGRCLARDGIWLAAGRDPADLPRLPRVATTAASVVWRRFDGCGIAAASVSGRRWLRETHPNARLWLDDTSHRSVQRQYRWLGSYRYAVLNCSGDSLQELQSLSDECGQRLFGADAARPVIVGQVGGPAVGQFAGQTARQVRG